MINYHAPIPIPGYEALIVKHKRRVIDKASICSSCNKEVRFILKSGRRDTYCVKCRAIKNHVYREARAKRHNRFKTKIGRRYYY